MEQPTDKDSIKVSAWPEHCRLTPTQEKLYAQGKLYTRDTQVEPYEVSKGEWV